MLANFVQESTSAPGTATTINLTGAAAGRRRFRDAFASGSRVLYTMEDGTQWETGFGTLTHGTPDQLARTEVLDNSANTLARLNFTGVTRVYNIVPAQRLGPQLIRRQVVTSAVAAVDFVLPGGFSSFQLAFRGVRLATDQAALAARLSTDGGSTFLAGTDYAWSGVYNDATATAVGIAQASATLGQLTSALDNTFTHVAAMGRYDVFPGSGSLVPHLDGQASGYDGAVSRWVKYAGMVTYGATGTTANAIRLLSTSGNIAAGTFDLLGQV